MDKASRCRFCEILEKKDEDFAYEDQEVFVIKDRFPLAPVHFQIVAKQHFKNLNQLTSAHESLLGRFILIAKEIADKEGIAETGYRLIFNVGREGGQGIDHVHLHLVGGRQLKWDF
jgi:histidine triad (HIT) family protein